MAEVSAGGAWTRGYVYMGGQLVAVQGGTGGQVTWVHQEPLSKGQRLTNSLGNLVSTIELDPFGGDTSRSVNGSLQPHQFTSYERDTTGGMDEAQQRRYHGWWSRFDQPDPYDGSYDVTDPQSFNRYSYVANDPVNFVDPSGLHWELQNCHTNWVWKPHIEGGGDWYDMGETCDLVWVPDGPFGGGGGGGGGGVEPQNPAPKVLFDFATLNDCTEKLFGVTVKSFTPSNRGSNGSFTGFGPDTIGNGGNNANITVANDVNRYSSSQALAISNASLIANGQRPLPANTFIYGFTDSSSPYTNFTSNNVRNTVEIVKTQIHELGNSLRYITGAANNDRARVPDPDAGNRLENCVFKTRR